MPLLGMTVTSASRELSHVLNLTIDILMLGGVTTFIWYKAWTERRLHERSVRGVYGPALLVSVAFVLIVADPTRHVLQDMDIIEAPMYKPDCHVETFACLSIIGWFVTVICTYVGYGLFIVGVLWNSNMFDKIATQWRDLRGITNSTIRVL